MNKKKTKVNQVKLEAKPDTYSIVCTFATHDTDRMKTLIDAEHNKMLIDNWYDETLRPVRKHGIYKQDGIKLCPETVEWCFKKINDYFMGRD